jgi:hypothetical protein
MNIITSAAEFMSAIRETPGAPNEFANADAEVFLSGYFTDCVKEIDPSLLADQGKSTAAVFWSGAILGYLVSARVFRAAFDLHVRTLSGKQH